jgi:protein-S-isoprenylcysteine O-methyltransferase Ste14
MAFVSLGKLKREAVPLIFFGTVVSTKVYFLFKTLFLDGGYAELSFLIQHGELAGPGASYVLANMLSYIFYTLIAILFDALVFYSYLIRHEPVNRARGFWETVYPLATVLIPVTGFTLLVIPGIRAMLPSYDFRTLATRYELTPAFFILLNVVALVIGAVGAALSFLALWSLKKSFSLMTEIRVLVTSGLYRRIRHPLYMSEIIHVFGIAILSGTPVGLWLFVIAVAMEVVRAKIEERKFLRTVPEYAEFQANTGFLWPKLW